MLRGRNRNSSEGLLYVHRRREEDSGMHVHSEQRLASGSRVTRTSTSLMCSGPLLGSRLFLPAACWVELGLVPWCKMGCAGGHGMDGWELAT